MKNIFLVNLTKNKSELKFISDTLYKNIEQSFSQGKKVILYLNRRGEYSSLICTSCQKIYECDNCNVTLKVHNNGKLICHSCGFSKNIPPKCSDCGEKTLLKVGLGTQQIESILKNHFKNKKIFRFDTDNIKNISEKKEALGKLKEADLIIGTKMITTGFDFQNVGTIGIVLLEQELTITDYKTEENVYSNIRQVIGRGGRLGEETDIIIQTFIPENELIQTVTFKNYKDFFIENLKERKDFGYPPFGEIAEVFIKDKDKDKSYKKSEKFVKKLESINSDEIKFQLIESYQKRNKNYIFKIVIKGVNIRGNLQTLKKDILIDKNINIEFK